MQTIIIGAGGHGRVALDILQAAGMYQVVGFLDADVSLAGRRVGGLPVLGSVNLLPKLRQQRIGFGFVAIGDNRVRRQYAALLREHGLTLINAVHPSACVSASASMGENVLVAAGAVICAECRLADSVIINSGAVVDHECEIEESAHICTGAHLAGRVRVGPGAFVGMGANIIQCLSIGEEAVVGAGAVVIRDIPSHATAVGVPASVIKSSVPSEHRLAGA
jgi:UDP-perosamine 4-acetyltransferase